MKCKRFIKRQVMAVSLAMLMIISPLSGSLCAIASTTQSGQKNAQENAEVYAQENAEVYAQENAELYTQADSKTNAQAYAEANAQTKTKTNAQANAEADIPLNANANVPARTETNAPANVQANAKANANANANEVISSQAIEDANTGTDGRTNADSAEESEKTDTTALSENHFTETANDSPIYNWRETASARGIYEQITDESLIGVYYQGETVEEILQMLDDPSLANFNLEDFFRYTIFRVLSRQELQDMAAAGVSLEDYLNAYLKRPKARTLTSDTAALSVCNWAGRPGARIQTFVLDNLHGTCVQYGVSVTSGTIYTKIANSDRDDYGYLYNVEQQLGFNKEQQMQVAYARTLWDTGEKDAAFPGHDTTFWACLTQGWVWYSLGQNGAGNSTAQAIMGHMQWCSDAIGLGWNLSEDYMQSILDWTDNFVKTKGLTACYYYTAGPNNQWIVTSNSSFKLDTVKAYIALNKSGRHSGAAISGAVYGIYHDNSLNNLLASITTNENGYGLSDAITIQANSLGTYYVKEIKAPIGTNLDPAIYPVQLSKDNHADNPALVNGGQVSNEEWSASLSLSKADPLNGTKLKGAIFELYEWEGSSYIYKTTLKDQGNGSYASDVLYFTPINGGRFKITETKPPDGFVNSGWLKEFTITEDHQTFTYEITNSSWDAEVSVVKVDEESQAKLSGAVFGLYEWNGSSYVRAACLTDNKDGTYHSGTIRYTQTNGGKFKLAEEKAPPCYVNTGWSQEFIMSEDHQTFTYEVSNRGWTGQVTVTKLDDVSNQKLPGAQFDLYEWNGETYVFKTALTDLGDGTYHADGLEYVSTNLGKFKLVEAQSPDHYTNSGWQQEFILGKDKQLFAYTVTNQEQMGSVEIYKHGPQLVAVDAESSPIAFIYEDRPLAGAVFEIYAAKAIYTRDINNTLLYEKDQLVGSMTGAKDGTASLQIPIGEYYYKEVKTPEGFVLDDAAVHFSIQYQGQHAQIATAYQADVHNERKALRLSIDKKDSDTHELLEGAVFGLYTTEDIYSLDGILLLKADSLIEEGRTDETGTLLFNSDLPFGYDYYIKELQAPFGYSSCDDVVEVRGFKADGSEDDGDNKPENGQGEGENNTQSNIGRNVQLDVQSNMKKNVQVDVHRNMVENVQVDVQEITQVVTEDNIREQNGTGTPAEMDGAVQEQIDDRKIKIVQLQHEFFNTVTTVEFSKKDISSKEELIGAQLELLDEEGIVIESWISQTQPHMIKGLQPGMTYTLRETNAPCGYITAEAITFDVKDTGELQTVEMYDDYTKYEFIKKDRVTDKVLSGALLAVYETDEKGSILDEEPFAQWTSSEEAHQLTHLKAEGTYVLMEIEAPGGYSVADPIFFTVQSCKEPVTITMYDEPIPGKITGKYQIQNDITSKSPQTSDLSNKGSIAVFIMSTLAVVALIFSYQYRKRKERFPGGK